MTKSITSAPAVPPRNKQGMRTGYTTGSNAAAATKAAAIALLTGERPAAVTIHLPVGRRATFTPAQWEEGEGWVRCGMIKDAGDDPDVTHGALICARVAWCEEPGLRLDGGVGVGRVTLPGLGLDVGGPAINPVPRQQIMAAAEEVFGRRLETRGVEVIIEVPAGQALARQTLNPRLGILGGISILGTSGIVYPYSTSSWKASVVQAVELAAYNHRDLVVMSTGARSERFAMGLFPGLPEVAFVELSVFTGPALRACVKRQVRKAVFVGMIGKMAKTAQGHMVTHVAGNGVDLDFLAEVAERCGARPGAVAEMRAANTARHWMEICERERLPSALQHLTELACQQCFDYARGRLDLEAILVDFNGPVLGRARRHRDDPGIVTLFHPEVRA
ncbi:MAG: cobalt-precorrin-5B (C(1))-methyltransferase [Ardenticatenaceae bacterium]|nr:cobalt-precorrin-5B (C(1))-methyltransferase [Ardenticatenaceae bacterium]